MTTAAPFGRVLTAMATAFHDDGSVDLEGTARIADAPRRPRPRRRRRLRHDGGVADHQHRGGRRRSCARRQGRGRRPRQVVAGVGTNDTAHSVELAPQAEKIGADGVLLVTPYYNKPSQAGVLAALHARSPRRPTCR